MVLAQATTLETVNTLVQVASLFVVAGAAIAAVLQIRHLRASNELDALLRLSAELRSEEVQRAFRFVHAELADALADPAYRADLAHIGFIDEHAHPEIAACNWFNQVGTLVKNRLIDESTFLDLFARLVTYYWSKLEPAIAILRRERGAGQYENFEYLAALATRWRAKHPVGDYPKRVARLQIADPWLERDATA